jgi:hypothetical protein
VGGMKDERKGSYLSPYGLMDVDYL